MNSGEAVKLLRIGGASCHIWQHREEISALIESQQAQIAECLEALNNVKEDWIYHNGVKFASGEEFGLIQPKTADKVFKALRSKGTDYIDRYNKLLFAAQEVCRVMRPWYNQGENKDMPEPMVVVENLQQLANAVHAIGGISNKGRDEKCKSI